MNKTKQETFKRSDIEKSLKKQFPNLSNQEIRKSIDAILDSIIEAVALDEKVEMIICLKSNFKFLLNTDFCSEKMGFRILAKISPLPFLPV